LCAKFKSLNLAVSEVFQGAWELFQINHVC